MSCEIVKRKMYATAGILTPTIAQTTLREDRRGQRTLGQQLWGRTDEDRGSGKYWDEEEAIELVPAVEVDGEVMVLDHGSYHLEL
jgi:hypothetical protein